MFDSHAKSELLMDKMENTFQIIDTAHPNDYIIYQAIYNHGRSTSDQKSIFFTPSEVKNARSE